MLDIYNLKTKHLRDEMPTNWCNRATAVFVNRPTIAEWQRVVKTRDSAFIIFFSLI